MPTTDTPPRPAPTTPAPQNTTLTPPRFPPNREIREGDGVPPVREPFGKGQDGNRKQPKGAAGRECRETMRGDDRSQWDAEQRIAKAELG